MLAFLISPVVHLPAIFQVNAAHLCRHPFQEKKRAYVKASKVEPLYHCYWQRGQLMKQLPTIAEIKERG